MLVLSRKLGEKIRIGIGDNVITVTVVEIKNGQVRLGIKAPSEVPVNRQEVHNRRNMETDSASS